MIGLIGLVDGIIFYHIPMTLSIKKIAVFICLKLALKF